MEVNLDTTSTVVAVPPAGPQPTISHATRSRFTNLLLQTDLVSALDVGHDRAFQARIEHGGAHFDIEAVTAHMEQVRTQVANRTDIPAEARNTIRRDLALVQDAIDAFTVPSKARFALLPARLMLSALPLILPLRSSPPQLKTMTVMIAAYVKTNTLGAGLLLRPTTDWGVVRRHLKSRDFANNFQAVALLANMFRDQRSVSLAHNATYNGAMGVVAVLGLFGMFYGGEISRRYNALVHGSATPSLSGVDLPAPRQNAIRFLGDSTARHRESLANEKAAFTEEGLRLSDSADWQVNRFLERLDQLRQDLHRLSGEQQVRRTENPDLMPKTILAVMSMLLCAGAIPYFRKEPIAIVDLAADAFFTTFHMGATALNPNAGFQQSMDDFKQWVGLSTVMLVVFGVDELLRGSIDHSLESFAAFAGGLSLANMLLPALVGAGVAYTVERILDKVRSGSNESALSDLRTLGDNVIVNTQNVVADGA